MSFSQDAFPVRRPATARTSVTEFDGFYQINPSPKTPEGSHLLIDLYLSPEKLRNLSGSDDLDQVTTLEMCVDTRQNTLGNFGVHLPSLVQLKMNNSLILSVRDLGTTLSHLRILSLVRCGLADLDGILSLSSLKELYLAYNNVSDLSQVSMLEQLELLDVEGNDVDDLVQVQYLGLCGQLRALSLEGNPVCTSPHPGAVEVPDYRYNYRSVVRKLVPQLRYLDDVPTEEEEPCCSSAMTQDWALLKYSIKDNPSIIESTSNCLEVREDRAASARGMSRPGSAQHPDASGCPSDLPSGPGTVRPLSSSTGSRPSSVDSDPDTPDPEASDLTHGVGRILFCGNPLQAIRARRQKIRLQGPSSHARPCTQLGGYAPEHTCDVERDCSDIFAELRAWRAEHSKRFLAIEKDDQAQSFVHSNEDDDGNDSDEEYDEESHNRGLISDREAENEQEGESFDHRDTDSPDSCFQSSPPDHTPSPPPRDTAPSSGRMAVALRARRLRLSASVGMQKPIREILLPDPTLPRRDRALKAVSPMKSQPVPPHILCKPHRPSSCPVASPLMEHSAGTTDGNNLSDGERKPIICSTVQERRTPTRPHTAKAILQRTSGHRALLSGKGSPNLD
ncbi:leucine-rich repeat-containing protein 56 isoform X2 [Electrophorus electricus]|uniref:leucine-rich repeat-containing protein 56 isoform X2 n=1 Tax=Electrophorus electricus TaxID=8005 RepID=UPI0015D01967|nr:leucine-rich repeat-containing protein 56 isoform X2 [Electrophorus electricus]